MFNDLFIRRGIIARYHAAPLFDERLSYLAHCAQGGARRKSLRTIAAYQVNLIHLLDLHEGERVSLTQIEAATVQWSLPGGRRCRQTAEPAQGRRFFSHAVRWLRFIDMLEEPEWARHSHTGEVATFTAWMRKERGWSEDTVQGCCGTVDCFFDWLDEWGIALASVEIVDIDRAVVRWHARDLSRVTIHDYVQRLRAFFRFAEQQGWCTTGLADGIKLSRFHAGATVPKGLARDEVLRLLATTESNQPVDVRDRAILMALIAYGLRSGEVAGLRFDDLDWQEEMLRVRCPKPGRTHHYPLSRGVGEAILRYIADVRPPRPDRILFLTLNAPIRPMTRGAIGHVVSSRLDRLGIVGKRRGPHALRHAAAQHLLDRGLSMKEVGDYLGHRSVSATSVYAKVQLGTLREVADIDLEGLA